MTFLIYVLCLQDGALHVTFLVTFFFLKPLFEREFLAFKIALSLFFFFFLLCCLINTYFLLSPVFTSIFSDLCSFIQRL